QPRPRQVRRRPSMGRGRRRDTRRAATVGSAGSAETGAGVGRAGSAETGAGVGNAGSAGSAVFAPAAGSGSVPTHRETRGRAVWAVVITGLALFMASLDNLVVSTALPVIRVHLHAGLSGLEWTVNAYTLTFAVLLLSAAAVGERLGRRRTFVAGIAVFTVSSAMAALSPSIGMLVAARALEGVGGAMI